MRVDRKPYIGVTDFDSFDQVRRLVKWVPPSHRLHVGVMCSYKTLMGLPSKWHAIWPTHGHQAKIFQKWDNVYNVIHYADFEHPDVAPTTHEQLAVAVRQAGSHVNAIQLDMLWPAPKLIESLKESHKYDYCYVDVILQVSAKAMALDPKWYDRIADYKGLANYVLLDNGMGRGIQFDVDQFKDNIEKTLVHFNEDQIAVAGGLGPLTYHNLAPLLEQWPGISCDAQSRLRPIHDAMLPLDPSYAEIYIRGVASLIQK